MVVRSSDTDVLVILIGLAPKLDIASIILMDFGSSSNRRLIPVTEIAYGLEKVQAGFSEALIGFHALTGSDFTSAFHRKGKSQPFSLLEKHKNHLPALQSLCHELVDKKNLISYICKMYGHKTLCDMNEARYSSFIKMAGNDKVLSKLRKINCATLPPCAKVMDQHLLRVNYISMLWRYAHTEEPGYGLDPLNFGWKDDGNGHYVPVWFVGEALPENIPKQSDEEEKKNETDYHDAEIDVEDGTMDNDDNIEFDKVESDSQPWSSDSESDCESE